MFFKIESYAVSLMPILLVAAGDKLRFMMQPTHSRRALRNLSRLIGWVFGTFWALLAAVALPTPSDRGGYALAVVIALIFLIRLWKYEPNAEVPRPLFRTSSLSHQRHL